MKRLLLIRTYRDAGAGAPVPPLGLMYLASALRRLPPGPREIRILDTGLLAPRALERAIASFSPDFAGLSALSSEAGLMKETAALLKRTAPGVFVAAGGPHPSADPGEALSCPDIDCAVVGEGEDTAVELLTALERGSSLADIAGLAWKRAGTPVVNPARTPVPDLDRLPWPAWDLVDLRAYGGRFGWSGYTRFPVVAPVLTSRGCPYRCAYCHNIFGKRVRARSPENVVQELLFLNSTFGVREFHFVDDVFNFDRNRAARICRLILESGLKAALAFPNGLRADLVDEDLLGRLKAAGTYKIHYGVETASPRIRGLIEKDLTLESVTRAVELTDKAGIISGGYFMLGFPGETAEELKETADFAAASRFDAAYFFKVTAYPGTRLFEMLPPERREDYLDASFRSTSGSYAAVTASELNRALMDAQRRFYLDPRRLWRLLRKSPNPALFLKAAARALAVWLEMTILLASENPRGSEDSRPGESRERASR